MAAVHVPRYPANASDEYKDARAALLQEEWNIRQALERAAEMRRNLPAGAPMKDYVFTEGPADITQDGPLTQTSLADLAADGRSVVIYHLMFGENDSEACSMCSCTVDGLNGVAKHIGQHANFAIVAKGPIDKVRAFARKRGWTNARFLSSLDNSFNTDMHLEHPEYMPDVEQQPGISVFRKDKDGVVRHIYTASAHFDKPEGAKGFPERGTDVINPTWNVLDLIPEGRGTWYAGNDYV